MNRYIPRIEGLEERELLDACLPQAAAPPSSRPTPEVQPPVSLGDYPGDDFPFLLDARPAVGEELPVGPAQDDAAGDDPFAVVRLRDGLLTDPSDEGWQFVQRYARKAIRNDEQRFGPLADHDDIVHQVYVEWWEKVGATDEAFGNLLRKDSAERAAFRKTVRRVLDHERYERGRKRAAVDVAERSSPAKQAAAEWLDFRIDVDGGVGGLNSREREILLLRGQGKTVDEIGSELGLAKQRVSEVCKQAISSLRRVYDRQDLELAAR